MVVGEIPEGVDLLVVGGGPGGYIAALAAAREGRRVTLVDAGGLGGACLTVGCIPSKALIELAGHVADRPVWEARGAGRSDPAPVDLGAFQRWKAEVVGDLQAGVRTLLDAAGVEVRRGHFRFTRPDRGALVTDPELPPTHLQFASAIIATGSRPAALPDLPFGGGRIISSTEALDLDRLPTSIAIVGGGYIGVEIGTALAKLGAAVTLVEMADRLLPELEPAAGRAVTRRLRELGATVHTGARAAGDDGTTLAVDTPAGRIAVTADLVMVAVGRTPNTDDLGLEALGIQPAPGGLLPVGPDLLLTDRVAAIGDITPGPALAHRASAQAEVAAAVLSGRAARFDSVAIPAVVFADPEIAQAGLTAAAAGAAGYRMRSTRCPLTAVGRSRTLASATGSIEYVWDGDSGILLGALIIGPHASELIAEATLAIEMGAHLEDLAGTIHTHPTLAEIHHEVAAAALGRPIHTARRPAGTAATIEGAS